MPVEIRELIIRTTVDKQNKKPSTHVSGEDCTTPPSAQTNQVRVDEVLKLIKNKNER
ncbi:DUF5908 family protein [Arenibacter amylolyticus]|uniref:DUF5908 family protein n=1 Tax=Arenibacter amylolyticus TaxID=1406873 RepID=UPI0015941247|nr:DUF5908 family protein [Arenibacter amylolyticus]